MEPRDLAMHPCTDDPDAGDAADAADWCLYGIIVLLFLSDV